MSKLNRIDKKRRFNSFLIYSLVSVWLLFGCATKSSMDTADVDSQSSVEDMNTGNRAATVSGENSAADEKITNSKSENKDSVTLASQEETEEKEYLESKPRIFIKPTGVKLGQILGIDFSMLPQGKSRLTITTNKKVGYDLDSVNANTLALNIYESKIGLDVLLRYIDTIDFQTPVEKINPVFDEPNNKVTLGIIMREVVPYTIKQSDTEIIVDFDQIKSKVAERKITPLNLVEAETQSLAAVTEPTSEPRSSVSLAAASQPKSQSDIQMFSPSVEKKYTGAKMDFEFVNVDVTHLLQLINEVSGENIIWDPGIKGRNVSMILKDVPWDEALELILKNNELAKRYVGENIVWITTKQKMAQIINEEEAAEKRLNEKLEAERQKLIDDKKRIEDDSPLMTEYINVNFAKASEIKDQIVLSKRGRIRVESNTNTIIITDTESSIEEAIKIKKKFDIPIKQIMIEARIVDATENFSRELGLKWNDETSYVHDNDNTSMTLPASALDDLDNPGQRVSYGSFSTNTPEGWAGNIGLNYAKQSASGMGRLTLDATLALAESEGTARVMSAPKVIAREGASATISSGDKIIIEAKENVPSTTLDATLSLTVSPTTVSYNDYITLDVKVTDDQAPSTSKILKKAINTTLMVKSGETVVIGGIIKETEGEDITGIPVLKDIPGLGWLFKAKRKNSRKSELLIFLTPTVLPFHAEDL